MLERHRSSRSRPSFAADSAVVDADSSPKEKGEASERKHVANCRCCQFEWAFLSLSLSFSLLVSWSAKRRWRGASTERWSKKRRRRAVSLEEEGSWKRQLWAAEGGGPQDEVEGRQRVICDSKRAIHLATCQHSIVGICLWNQSRRTHPRGPCLASAIAFLPPFRTIRQWPVKIGGSGCENWRNRVGSLDWTVFGLNRIGIELNLSFVNIFWQDLSKIGEFERDLVIITDAYMSYKRSTFTQYYATLIAFLSTIRES